MAASMMRTNSSCNLMKCCLLLGFLLFGPAFLYFFGCPCFHCPKDDSYPTTCTRSAIPPWPICLIKDVKGFVAKSQDGATRCCKTDLSECKCPKKDTDKFKDEIESWCADIATCDAAATAAADDVMVSTDEEVVFVAE
uniref:Uncharacterized protein n=1 Tax=Grammatophora oceanica TaxID=210454 RepID=A0A7S1VJ52_9STRA|mmetsp:Transcript_46334/g.68987  ORF Transcript_46334/g.68987 Transcript_46334/m.68987 type:complete len:138 (+) Transcript_46334:49-462(+)